MSSIAAIISTLTAVAGVLTALVSLVKAIQATAQAKAVKEEADAIKAARVLTQESREREYNDLKTKVAVLQAESAAHGKRLDEGSNEFKTLAEEMKTNNALLNQVLGALKQNGYKVGNHD